MIFTEDQLRKIASPLSKTEEDKCRKAIQMIKDALKDSGYINKSVSRGYDNLSDISERVKHTDKKYNLRIFLQGSYANNTNVKQNSDVDILIIQEDCFRAEYRYGVKKEDYGFISTDDNHEELKNDVEHALISKFGDRVKRKNKSIKIRENGYIVNTDIVPSLQYRNYSNDYHFDKENYIPGILIKADDGQEIVNYPEQHIKNGKEKNSRTGRRYKRMVRIIKKLRYLMVEEGRYPFAKQVSSFGLECLLYNIPDEIYNSIHNHYGEIMEDIRDWLYNYKSLIDNFGEVNEVKQFCDSDEKLKAYLGFIDEFKVFFNYER